MSLNANLNANLNMDTQARESRLEGARAHTNVRAHFSANERISSFNERQQVGGQPRALTSVGGQLESRQSGNELAPARAASAALRGITSPFCSTLMSCLFMCAHKGGRELCSLVNSQLIRSSASVWPNSRQEEERFRFISFQFAQIGIRNSFILCHSNKLELTSEFFIIIIIIIIVIRPMIMSSLAPRSCL